MEYLFSGVPVITTPSVGGRDEFFDKRHVVVVEPTASAVREAVERIVAGPWTHWRLGQRLWRERVYTE